MRTLLVAALLLLAPMVSAYGPDPRLYFLEDAENGPAGDGIFDINYPPFVDTEPNAQNKSAPGVRTVIPFMENVLPTQFVGGQGNNTGHLFGPIIVALWAPATPAMQNGTLVVTLLDVGEPSPAYPLPAQGEVIASAQIPLYWDNSSMGSPEEYIPNGTEPESIIAQVVADIVPLALYPPLVLILDDDVADYFVDYQLPQDRNLALRMAVVPPVGSTAPQGVGQPIEYDFMLAPSFVYIPWFNDTLPQQPADPGQNQEPTKSPGSTKSPGTPKEEPAAEPSGEESPGIGFVGLLGLLGVAFALRRRK